MLAVWNNVVEWWCLRKTTRCARCSYDAPRRILKRDGRFVVDCMGCDISGKPGDTEAVAVHNWNTDNRGTS